MTAVAKDKRINVASTGEARLALDEVLRHKRWSITELVDAALRLAIPHLVVNEDLFKPEVCPPLTMDAVSSQSVGELEAKMRKLADRSMKYMQADPNKTPPIPSPKRPPSERKKTDA